MYCIPDCDPRDGDIQAAGGDSDLLHPGDRAGHHEGNLTISKN